MHRSRPAYTVSHMDIAALIVACFGAVIAVLSLGWQIAAWTLEGRRVRVNLRHGAMGTHGFAVGNVGRDRKPKDLGSVVAEGFVDREVLGISVTNIGRATVTVTKYSVESVGGPFSFTPIGSQIGPKLPYRLPAGESETWYADMEDVHALVSTSASIRKEARRPVRMSVELGTGDVQKTRRKMQVHSRS